MPPCLLAYGAPIHHFHSLCCLPAQAPATQATVVNTVAKDVLDGEPGWVVWIEGQTYGRMENRMHEGLRQHGGQKDSDTKGGVHTVCGLDPPGKDTQGPAASPTCRSRCSNSHPIQRRRPRKAKKGHQEVQLEASCPQEVTRTTPVSSMLSSRWPPAYASCLCCSLEDATSVGPTSQRCPEGLAAAVWGREEHLQVLWDPRSYGGGDAGEGDR